MIWDLEFKREKTLMIREEVRREYDGTTAKLNVVETQIKSLPEDRKLWTDEQRRLDDKKILLEKDREKYIQQMKVMDLDVHGSKKTNEFPDGVDGITQQLEALRELQGILKSYIKTL
jgi:hypothetical protein